MFAAVIKCLNPMIAAYTTLDQIVKEIRLRFSAGFLAAAITRRLRNASSFCASGVTERPNLSANSSRITRRSHTPLRQTATAMISKNGTNILSWIRLPVVKAWKNPTVAGVYAFRG